MKILIGIDGSPGSDAATSMVGRIAPDEVNAIQLYYSDCELEQALRFENQQFVRDAVRKSITERLFVHACDLLPDRLREVTQTIQDSQAPATGILAAAGRFQPDLIAVGATGLGPIGRLLLGGVSHAVALGSSVPVLVGRQQERLPDAPLRVLLACGHPHEHDQRQAILLRLGWPGDTVARAIYVEDTGDYAGVPDWLVEQTATCTDDKYAMQWARNHQASLDRHERDIEGYCSDLPPPLRTSTTIMATGNAGQEIVRHAANEGADLVILGGSHRPGGWTRHSLGRTLEYVMATAPCSVLLVPHRTHP